MWAGVRTLVRASEATGLASQPSTLNSCPPKLVERRRDQIVDEHHRRPIPAHPRDFHPQISQIPADDLKWRFRHCLAFLSLDHQLLSAQSSQRLGDQLSSFYPTAVRAAPRTPLNHQLADERHRRFNPQLVGQRPTCHPTRRRDLAKVSKATARTIMMPIMIC